MASSLVDKVVLFKMEKDNQPFVIVRPTGKSLSCIADVACECAQTSGLTELSLEGHDLESQIKDPVLLIVIMTTWF